MPVVEVADETHPLLHRSQVQYMPRKKIHGAPPFFFDLGDVCEIGVCDGGVAPEDAAQIPVELGALVFSQIMRAYIVLLLLFAVALWSGRALELDPTAPSTALLAAYVNFTATDLMSPIFSGFGANHFNQTRVAVVRDTYNWSGRGLLVDAVQNGHSPEQTIKRALAAGAALGYAKPQMIYIWGGLVDAGWAARSRDNSDVAYIGVPVLQVSLKVWAAVTAVGQLTANASADGRTPLAVGVVARDDDLDPFLLQWSMSATVTVALLLTSAALACLTVCVYKGYYAFRYGPRGVTIAKAYFVIEFVAEVCRLWYACANPFFVNDFAFTWTTMAAATPMALGVICTLLLALKWQEILAKRKFKTSTVFLDRFRWPFIGAASAIFCVVFVSASFGGYWYAMNTFSEVANSFLIIMGVIVTVLLEATGVRILLELRAARAVDVAKSGTQHVRFTTWLIMLSGACLLGWCACQVAVFVMSAVTLNITLTTLNVLTTMQFVFMFVCSFAQSWALPVPHLAALHTATSSHASTATQQQRQSDGRSRALSFDADRV